MTQPTRPGQINWPTAAVIIAFLGALVAVAAFVPSQTSLIVIVGMAILGGIGLNVVRATEAKQEASAAKENTNGANAALLAIIKQQSLMLAQALPPVVSVPLPDQEGTVGDA